MRLLVLLVLVCQVKEYFSNEMATYAEVKDIPNHPDNFLIDVRNADELATTGIIPGSINIPMSELEAALQTTDEDFERRYGRAKPNKNAIIIFTCRSGARAATANDIAKNQGFLNTKTYSGSWIEWSKREGL